MPQQIRSSAAHAYAQSMLALANDSRSAEALSRELAELRQILQDNPSFRLYLADPGISTTERQQALDRIFRGKVSTLLFNVLGVLNEKNRLRILDQIADAFDELLEEQLGKVEVDVFVARQLPSTQLESVRQRVSVALKKDAVIHQYVDESIIGGFILRVGDKLIDASTKYQLHAMKEKLLQAPISETI